MMEFVGILKEKVLVFNSKGINTSTTTATRQETIKRLQDDNELPAVPSAAPNEDDLEQ